jgi:hypothetical protein
MNECVAQAQKTEFQQRGWSLRKERRAVTFTMTYQGIETEPMEVANPVILEKILRKYETLPLKEKVVYKFIGIKEEALPFGLKRIRQTAGLPNREIAIRYLKNVTDLPIA